MQTLAMCNKKTSSFGLSLSPKQAEMLIDSKNNSLKKYKRIELGNSILESLIDTFCDSQYIYQSNYSETLIQLQEIFYEFKNESLDRLTDSELLTFMKEQYETVCFGDINYLEGTCLDRFATAIKAGYRQYEESGGKGEYEQFSEEQRWDKNLYLSVLKDLCWD